MNVDTPMKPGRCGRTSLKLSRIVAQGFIPPRVLDEMGGNGAVAGTQLSKKRRFNPQTAAE